MRKAPGGFENTVFLCAATLFFAAGVAVAMAAPHLHLHNERLQFGMGHLPGALLAAGLFTVLVGGVRAALARYAPEKLEAWPAAYYLASVVGVFCLFWLPQVFAGDFDEDDWMLLAAASVRKVILLHPQWSWHALDAVDGNFRPLSTVLYFGYLFHWVGTAPLPYLSVLFAVNLLGCLTAFWITREMGYSKVAGAGACLLYLSRSLTYPIHTWPAALGDGLVILFCGLMALLLLKAIQRQGVAAAEYHVAAWACFCVATLAKQSAFAVPMIVGLLLLLRPGARARAVSMARRVAEAVAGVGIYGGTAAVMFFHGRSLIQEAPYPVEYSFDALKRVFAYPTWFFGTFEFPDKAVRLKQVPSAVGLVIFLGVLLLLWKVPKLLGERRRDTVFCLLAAVASISLFVLLANRVAPYYASMSAFWMSIAVGIGMTRFGPPRRENLAARVASFVFCGLLVVGFLDVRLKQTGLLPSGGYIWGTYTSSFHRALYTELRGALAAAPGTEVLVLTDMPGSPSYFAGMALIESHRLQTILAYDSGAKTYMANDLHGGRPRDEYAALNDTKAYNWTVPMDTAEATRLTARPGVLRLAFHNGKIVAEN